MRKLFFTLNELLIIVIVLLLIAALLIPYFRTAYSESRAASCKDSLIQLTRASILYASANNRFAPASIQSCFRWHGLRESSNAASSFDLSKGPLYKYMDRDKKIATCPTLEALVENPDAPAVEKGGFGYGYNENIGSLRYASNFNFWNIECEELGVSKGVGAPSKTVMFTDTATKVDEDGRVYMNGKFAEYSFCNSYRYVNKDKIAWGIQEPSIHFRHLGKANTAWVDGHISGEKMTFSKGEWGKAGIGFFGPRDNSLFDPL